MTDKIKQDARLEMEKVLEGLNRELLKVRTGKANVTMLDSVRVNYYGTPTPLNQVAALSTPDAKSFLIAPWEVSLLKEIESSIIKSDLGMSPLNDGKVIRLKVPELTEDRRKGLVKQIKGLIEEGRVAVRLKRRDANESLKKLLKDKKISEDESKRIEGEIQKMTDTFIAQLDKMSADKEKDVMTI